MVSWIALQEWIQYNLEIASATTKPGAALIPFFIPDTKTIITLQLAAINLIPLPPRF